MTFIDKTRDPSVGVRRRHLPRFAGEEMTTLAICILPQRRIDHPATHRASALR